MRHSVCQPGTAEGEKIVQQGVAQALGGGDDRLGTLNRIVDGVEHGGDGSLLGRGVGGEGESVRNPA